MHRLNRLVDFYIFSNIHVAIAAFCLTKLTLLEVGILGYFLPIFVGSATLMSYNLIRFSSLSTINPWMFSFIKKHKIPLAIVTILASLISIYYFLFLSLESILWLVPFVAFTLLYFLPIRYKGSRRTLRKVSRIKIFLIAFSWAGVTVLIPLVHYELKLDFSVWIEFIQRFLMLLVIILPFDIRDMDSDAPSLKTIPQLFGIEKAKKIGLFLVMIFLGLDFIEGNPVDFRIHIIMAVLTVILLVNARKEQHKYYSAFLVEGLPIVWLLAYLAIA